jgi:hypothetical protein
MNISLSGKGRKTKKQSIQYGLNPRKPASRNVFGGDEDSLEDDEDDDNRNSRQSGRALVNQQIAKEQAALRRRAQAALASAEDSSVYDFDGAYDSFKPKDDAPKKDSHKSNDERKSKYIGDLLKAAKVRDQERDAIFERKIAREQEEEDAKEEYQGKEKFVTKAYKRKLEERKQWEAEEERRSREEEANDVTKKTAGAAFASFYGNLNRNVAAGRGEVVAENVMGLMDDPAEMDDDDFDPRQGSSKGFFGDFVLPSQPIFDGNQTSEILNDADQPKEEDQKETGMSMRERRAKKIMEARIRYFKRKEAAQ